MWKGQSKSREEESGIDELRRAGRISEYVRESTFDGLTSEGCLNLMRACWASDWDILPDELLQSEVEFAAEYAKLSDPALKRLRERFG